MIDSIDRTIELSMATEKDFISFAEINVSLNSHVLFNKIKVPHLSFYFICMLVEFRWLTRQKRVSSDDRLTN